MTQRLFTSVHARLFELLGKVKYLGAKLGIIATRHTWSQTSLLNSSPLEIGGYKVIHVFGRCRCRCRGGMTDKS